MRVNAEGEHSYEGYEFRRGRLSDLWQRNNWTRDDFRFNGDIRATHERLWGNTTLFAGVGFIAFIVWIATLILKMLFPAKWSFIHGLLGIIGFIGKWVFFIAAGLIILLFILGWIFRIGDWLRNRQ